MQGKINWLEILNLPPYWEDTNWSIWDTIDLEWWKNLLLIWNKRTGKTTMLNILHDSLERAQNIMNWAYFWQYKNVVDLFFQISNSLNDDPEFWTWWKINLNLWFNGFLEEEHWSSQVDEWIKEIKESDIDEEVYRTIDILLKHVFWNGINRFIDESFSCTKGQLESKLCGVFHEVEIHNLAQRDKVEIRALPMVEMISRWARVYAERHNIPVKTMYWNLLFLALWIHPGQSDGWSKWGYIKVWWEEGFLEKPRLDFLRDEDDDTDSSGWNQDRRMQKIKDVDERGAIVFYDEPLAHQDRPSKKRIRQQILDSQWRVQWIIAEHDEILIDQAYEHDNWVVRDLGEK